MAVYGYTRVSTDRQAEDGESLGTQQRIIEGYAMMNALKSDKIFIEHGVSGSRPVGERPEGAGLVSTLPLRGHKAGPPSSAPLQSHLDPQPRKKLAQAPVGVAIKKARSSSPPRKSPPIACGRPAR